MKKLKDLIKPKPIINEAVSPKIIEQVGDLYAWAGVKSDYGDKRRKELVNRYSKEAVDYAEKMADKVNAYQKELKSTLQKMDKDPEMKLLIARLNADAGYRDSRDGYNSILVRLQGLY